MRLLGKVAVVTGGGAGIGEAVAKRYGCEGAKVVVAEINASTGAATAKAIQQLGGQALFVQTDVAREDNVRAMVSTALGTFGRIDILFNNAAVLFHREEARAHELSNDVWDRTIEVNLRGYWLCAKHVIPSMLKQGGGSIIHVASPTGLFGFTRLTAYSTSKGGVIGLTRAMAADYAPDRIRVNAIVPGTIDTPMNAIEFQDPEARRKFAALAPAGRLGLAEDLCGIAVFLASEESAYCVGGIFTVDGGMTAI
ncbi:MAG: SDR family NAD(P)-dependent oxidoreductase [Terriglobia bacterium]